MEGTGFGVPGVINFIREELPGLAQGDGVNLSTRVYLHSHQFGAVSCGKLEPGIKGQCSGRAWYTIRAGSAVPVCRVQWSSLHLIYGCQVSWGCTLGSSAGSQASWGVLWAHWWDCIRSGSVGWTGPAVTLPLKAWLTGVFLVHSGLGLLASILCRGVQCPLVSRALPHSLTAFHYIDRGQEKLSTRQRCSGHRNCCGCWEGYLGVVSGDCSDVFWVTVPVGCWCSLFTRDVLWGLCSPGMGMSFSRCWTAIYLCVSLGAAL